MIILGIVAACIAAVLVVLALLPAWTPLDMSGAIADLASGPGAQIFSGLGWLNHYVPVDTMLTLLGVQIGIWSALTVVRFVVWLLQLFHIAGGGSS